jgi:copper(I)-binding protein
MGMDFEVRFRYNLERPALEFTKEISMKPLSILFVGLILATLTACGTPATPRPAPSVRIGEAYISGQEISATDRSAMIHMTIENAGTAPDRLIRTETSFAEQTNMMNGAQTVEGIELAPGSKIEFTPTGYNIRVIGLRPDVTVGESFNLGMTFQSGDSRSIQIAVRP